MHTWLIIAHFLPTSFVYLSQNLSLPSSTTALISLPPFNFALLYDTQIIPTHCRITPSKALYTNPPSSAEPWHQQCHMITTSSPLLDAHPALHPTAHPMVSQHTIPQLPPCSFGHYSIKCHAACTTPTISHQTLATGILPTRLQPFLHTRSELWRYLHYSFQTWHSWYQDLEHHLLNAPPCWPPMDNDHAEQFTKIHVTSYLILTGQHKQASHRTRNNLFMLVVSSTT